MFADTIHRDYQTWESTLQISPGEVRGYKITFQKYKYLKEIKKKTKNCRLTWFNLSQPKWRFSIKEKITSIQFFMFQVVLLPSNDVCDKAHNLFN